MCSHRKSGPAALPVERALPQARTSSSNHVDPIISDQFQLNFRSISHQLDPIAPASASAESVTESAVLPQMREERAFHAVAEVEILVETSARFSSEY